VTGPLHGIKVLDLSIMAAGPWTGALLGELGAEVTKIEPPAGDGTRWVQPLQHGMGTNFISMNVCKNCTTLDLKSTTGRAEALRLASESDVLVENFRSGALERLGLGSEEVRRQNGQLIYCSITGFGSIGPLASERCADYIMQAFSGFARTNGPEGSEGEQFRFTGYLDLTTSAVATEAILVALLDRERTGKGQHVDVSMLEAALEIQFSRVAELLAGGAGARPLGSESSLIVPDRAYEAEDREILVTVHDDAEWRRFCAAIKHEELLSSPQFATNRLRVANREALDGILEPIFFSRPAVWWLRTFERHRVPVGLLGDFESFRYHSQVVDNDMVAEVSSPWGTVALGGLPWHFSETPCAVTAPTLLDERDAGHTLEVEGVLVADGERGAR
jgi:crotonobetainyl-CoA:carnitine CoA-transferase CaiB-like acyl-CoA transferase